MLPENVSVVVAADPAVGVVGVLLDAQAATKMDDENKSPSAV